MTELPTAVRAMAARGPQWAAWLESLPHLVRDVVDDWQLRPDGKPTHGFCSLVSPVRTVDGVATVLKIGFPDDESEHEHLALRRWAGDGAVRLLRADPHRRALLLERLRTEDLTGTADVAACRIVAALYPRLHLPAMPQLRTLASYIDRWTSELEALPRSAPIPHRLVEQAISLARDLVGDSDDRVLHGDLHYGNVLAAEREPWLVIDPKPMNGDPHYELAPMLCNRWDELAGDVRHGVRQRFYALVEATGFDEDRARDWVVVRMVHNAMWALQDGPRAEPGRLTRCISIAKAVRD